MYWSREIPSLYKCVVSFSYGTERNTRGEMLPLNQYLFLFYNI